MKRIMFLAALLLAPGPAIAGPDCLGLLLAISGTKYCLGLPAQGVQSTVTIKVCPQTRSRDAAFQKQALAELKTLPQGSALEGVVSDWINLRDQARACRGGS